MMILKELFLYFRDLELVIEVTDDIIIFYENNYVKSFWYINKHPLKNIINVFRIYYNKKFILVFFCIFFLQNDISQIS